MVPLVILDGQVPQRLQVNQDSVDGQVHQAEVLERAEILDGQDGADKDNLDSQVGADRADSVVGRDGQVGQEHLVSADGQAGAELLDKAEQTELKEYPDSVDGVDNQVTRDSQVKAV